MLFDAGQSAEPAQLSLPLPFFSRCVEKRGAKVLILSGTGGGPYYITLYLRLPLILDPNG